MSSSERKRKLHRIEKQVHKKFGRTLNFSWLKKRVLSEVRDQGRCGCCWTMPTTGAVEAKYLIDLKKSIGRDTELPHLPMAPQQLLDCLKRNPKSSEVDKKGCYSANYRETYSYIQRSGLYEEHWYPYEGTKRDCQCRRRKFRKADRYFIDGTTVIDPIDHKSIKKAIREHPVAVGITMTKRKAKELKHCKDGIFHGNTFLELVNEVKAHKKSKRGWKKDRKKDDKLFVGHGLLLVGYGRGYYLTKNSWGEDWGYLGFGRISTSTHLTQLETIQKVRRVRKVRKVCPTD